MLRSRGITDRGLVRAGNEDAFVADEALGLFVVADGMGGHNAGEVASRAAVEAIEAFIRQSHGTRWTSWPFGHDSRLSLDGNRLRTAIFLANQGILRLAETRAAYAGMGTTVAVALLAPGRAAVGHAGDSRVYLLSAGELIRLTEDDSWSARVLRNGAGFKEHDLASHPMRHVLTNVLGIRDDVDVHVQELELRAGERLLLCSDGLHGLVDDSTIAALAAHDDIDEASTRLVNAALDAGGRDNVTAVLVGWDGVP
jgi:serine/threonine protein phosphatase PrpC